ncbi:SIMPL domain-containing protein [Flavobacterium columnare NBRC 100251 = ATCC 23463]|uniref:DUF541 domain-containing protein n=2 Tax=Flavobacterium columnare TaxID=996 RepID=G8XA39_FLACA|nr:SIMPL domain-containing protein [Flavobacterium columnare]AEW85203.2 hypothetical protein FCOL_01770 [Flavobacterium columnare ATCC 49512]AMO19573.1 DUF541 domain-containing protein [Flavobacterium columnare]ANO49017.1 hypothetical protein Pf1_00769 [Flavobacterium columnare]APT22974.1 SIMPL domain-containing protein [Flavobacterium columnare]AUX17505.1 hypothetical protein AQ623_03845 [Flavobacterium columnare]
MKKLITSLLFLMSFMMQAQEFKQQVPQINVSGEGKIKTVPDQCLITLGVENTAKDAATAKKMNDDIIIKLIQYIKGYGISASDYQTTDVNLNKNYDYEKKKYNFYANQTITILFKDIKKYNDFMLGVTDTGITNIRSVEFKTSKLEELEKEARKKAMLNAKQKAEDFVSALGQKVGKILLITDNSSSYYPQQQPMMYKSAMMAETLQDGGNKDILAVGEMTVVVNVQAAFVIE